MNNINDVFVQLAELAITSGLIAGLFKLFTKRINEKLEDAENKRVASEAINQQLHHDAASRQEALEKGVQALLRNRLIYIHDKYCPTGDIPLYIKDDFDNLYQQYHNLGQNGVMDAFHEEVMNLPTRPNQ